MSRSSRLVHAAPASSPPPIPPQLPRSPYTPRTAEGRRRIQRRDAQDIPTNVDRWLQANISLWPSSDPRLATTHVYPEEALFTMNMEHIPAVHPSDSSDPFLVSPESFALILQVSISNLVQLRFRQSPRATLEKWDGPHAVIAACEELAIPVVAYSPLGRGFLTGAVTQPDDFEQGDFRRTLSRFQEENMKANAALQDSAARKGVRITKTHRGLYQVAALAPAASRPQDPERSQELARASRLNYMTLARLPQIAPACMLHRTLCLLATPLWCRRVWDASFRHLVNNS